VGRAFPCGALQHGSHSRLSSFSVTNSSEDPNIVNGGLYIGLEQV
jgi:hypothetical protein